MALLKSQSTAETPFLIYNSKCFQKLGPTQLHLTFLQYGDVNALCEAPVCTLWASGTTEMPCKTQQWARDALPTMKAGSTASFLMQQHNPHPMWTGNFIIYQILYVLMNRNKHSYRNAVIKRWLSEHLSLDKAEKFDYTNQRLKARRI